MVRAGSLAVPLPASQGLPELQKDAVSLHLHRVGRDVPTPADLGVGQLLDIREVKQALIAIWQRDERRGQIRASHLVQQSVCEGGVPHLARSASRRSSLVAN